MAKAKKNAARSGNKQRTHTKQHLTQEALAQQKSNALSRAVATAHKYIGDRTEGHYAPNTKKNLTLQWTWGDTPRKPRFTVVKDSD